jgi:HPt (histidine-containing phosphotransfer) domain-containing protein
VHLIDRGYVARIAHMLRGAVGNIGAQAICAAASQLERSGRAGDRAQAAAASATLETELERLVPVLIAPNKEVVL